MAQLSFPQPAPAGDAEQSAGHLAQIAGQLREAPDQPLLLSGAGEGFVIAGPLAEPELHRQLIETVDAIEAHQAPVIAALPGRATDSGLELALACDLRYLDSGGQVGFPAAPTGWLPASGAVGRLARLAGDAAASRTLLLGELLDPATAPQLARAFRLCTDDDSLAQAEAALAQISAGAPLALEAIKVALAGSRRLSLAAGAELEADLAGLLLDTEDRAEGIAAFRERRPPHFHGR